MPRKYVGFQTKISKRVAAVTRSDFSCYYSEQEKLNSLEKWLSAYKCERLLEINYKKMEFEGKYTLDYLSYICDSDFMYEFWLKAIDYKTEYFRTWYWETIRKYIFMREQDICQDCGMICKNAQIYHDTDDIRGHEYRYEEDLYLLCEKCNNERHKTLRRRGTEYKQIAVQV